MQRNPLYYRRSKWSGRRLISPARCDAAIRLTWRLCDRGHLTWDEAAARDSAIRQRRASLPQLRERGR